MFIVPSSGRSFPQVKPHPSFSRVDRIYRDSRDSEVGNPLSAGSRDQRSSATSVESVFTYYALLRWLVKLHLDPGNTLKRTVTRTGIPGDNVDYSDANLSVVGRFPFLENQHANCIDTTYMRLFPSFNRSWMSGFWQLCRATSAAKTCAGRQSKAKKTVDNWCPHLSPLGTVPFFLCSCLS